MGRPAHRRSPGEPTRLGTGSDPIATRASISSLRLIEPSSAASPAPILAATSTPASTGPSSTTTATARKLGKADSAPFATSRRWVWNQVTIPTLAPAPRTIGRLLTATCSNCQITSPNRPTRAAGIEARVRAVKSRKRPSCSRCQIPCAIISRLHVPTAAKAFGPAAEPHAGNLIRSFFRKIRIGSIGQIRSAGVGGNGRSQARRTE